MIRSESGFALVEAIVSLGIVAAILGATFKTIAMARGAMAAAEARRTAMLEARSKLAELGSTLPLVPGTVAGEVDGWRWRADIEPANGRNIEAPLMLATVTIDDEHGRTLARLETLRLVR